MIVSPRREPIRSQGWQRHPQDLFDSLLGSVAIRCVHDEVEDGHSGVHQIIV